VISGGRHEAKGGWGGRRVRKTRPLVAMMSSNVPMPARYRPQCANSHACRFLFAPPSEGYTTPIIVSRTSRHLLRLPKTRPSDTEGGGACRKPGNIQVPRPHSRVALAHSPPPRGTWHWRGCSQIPEIGAAACTAQPVEERRRRESRRVEDGLREIRTPKRRATCTSARGSGTPPLCLAPFRGAYELGDTVGKASSQLAWRRHGRAANTTAERLLRIQRQPDSSVCAAMAVVPFVSIARSALPTVRRRTLCKALGLSSDEESEKQYFAGLVPCEALSRPGRR